MGEDAPELTAEMVVDRLVPSQLVISPDGCWVAYVLVPVGRGGERRESALWLAAADGCSPPRKLTAGSAADYRPRWAPDSASVFFLSDRTGSVQLHRIRLDGGEAGALTDWYGQISDAQPLADARLVAVVATDEPTGEDNRRRDQRDDAIVWGERVRYGRLRLLDLATGKLRTLDGLGDRHVVEVAPRPDGDLLAVISWASPETEDLSTSELHVIDPGTGAARALGRVGPFARSPAWWQADGGWHLAYVASCAPSGGDAVYAVEVTAAPAVHHDLTEGMTVCPAGLAQVADGPPLRRHGRGAGEHLPRAGERPCRATRRAADPAQRHPSRSWRDHLGNPGTPLLPGGRWPRPRRPAHLAGWPQPCGRPVPAHHMGARRSGFPVRRSVLPSARTAGAVARDRRIRRVPAQPARRGGPWP